VNIRFIKFQDIYFVVVGIGYESKFNPPETYYAIPVRESLYRDLVLAHVVVKIPMSQAIEITDKNKVKALLVLFG
jgi:hypothetical protein